MKKIQRLIAVVLCLICSTAFVSCGKKDKDETSGDDSSSSDSKIAFTDYDLVSDGGSDYIIVVPQAPSAGEEMAWQDLKSYFRTATGVNLSVAVDSEVEWSESAEYLSVGKTELLDDAGITFRQSEVGVNGFLLQTKGRSVFMAGGKEYGSLYAVYRFMHDIFGFEVYAVDEIYCETGVTDVKVPDYAEKVIPDIQQLQSQYGRVIQDATNGLRLGYQNWKELWMQGYVESLDRIVEFVHNSLQYVPLDLYYDDHPDWFSADKSQLCFSNEEMYEEAFLPALKEVILAHPDVKNVSITQMDVRKWCTCEQCSADKERYGTDAGNMVKFGNKAARDISKWLSETDPDREVNLVIFAYHNCELPPAWKNASGEWEPIDKELVFEKNLVLWWVPSLANYKEPLYEGGNLSYGDSMRAWATMAHTIYVWNYEFRPFEYLVPYNTHNVLQKNMQFFRDYNVQLLFNQAEFNQNVSTDWGDLSIYLTSKLRWNVDADYQALIEDYFKHYYKDASKQMYKMFSHLRAFSQYQEDYLG